MPKGDRIQFDIRIGTKRYRPTIDMKPTQANLAYARKRHADIMSRIRNGVFDFAAEFPDYRFIDKVARKNRPTFNEVADNWLGSIGDKAFATRDGYRKILAAFWRPKYGEREIATIRYSELARAIGEHPWGSNKTRNNVLSVGCQVFGFAHADELIERDPTERLKSLKVQKGPPDPYNVEDAEAIIAAAHEHLCESDANYIEFNFFTGMRPSELIALNWSDVDLVAGTATVDKARVMGRDKDTTKTSVSRCVELCPRALDVLKRQKRLTFLAGENVFGHEDGSPYHDRQVPYKRWGFVHKKLTMRYREPYQMRHTSVTWNLMIEKNLLWVAANHGHSAAVMLKTYATWLKGTKPEDIEAIKRAMGYGKKGAQKVG